MPQATVPFFYRKSYPLQTVWLWLLLVLLLSCGPDLKAGTASQQSGDAEPFQEIDSLTQLRALATQSHVRVRLKPGTYLLDQADDHHFIRFTGSDNVFDLRGVLLRIDTRLFRAFGANNQPEAFYCALDLRGDRIVLKGLRTENIGNLPGIQSRNKIINICGHDDEVSDLDITTSGSNPWGYGSLFGISGRDVRKMNGIRVGYPATGARVLRCRVHMRAMGHGIFIQSAEDTLIEDCEVDGLLRPTKDILNEKSGYAFEHGFRTEGSRYLEGIQVGEHGEILTGEMISLSEDGIRLYDRNSGHDTGPTTIRRCRVVHMRRGICTGLGPAADHIIDCEAQGCVAAGFNIGAGDVMEHCRADALYAEALSCPYPDSSHCRVDLELLDSRGGLANQLLATINGRDHTIHLWTRDPQFIPDGFTIAEATHQGYAHYQKGPVSVVRLQLSNETPAKVTSGD